MWSFLFLASSFASTSLKTHKKGREGAERDHPEQMSKTGRSTLNVSNIRLYANHKSRVGCRKAHIYTRCVPPVSLHIYRCFFAPVQGLCDSLSHGRAWVCVFVRAYPVSPSGRCRCRVCLCVWHCVILQIRKTCRWVKSH